jgi:hypothetical protein
MVAPKRIVVDASVAQSAGSGKEPNEFSGPSRDALGCIEKQHMAVFNHELFAEWRRHERQFARRWRVKMVSRKKVAFLGDTYDGELREAIAEATSLPSEREAMLKDAHLVEAALATDRIVLSRDERVRKLFGKAAEPIPQIGEIHWANPERIEEAVVAWLSDGARADPKRWLRQGERR